MPGIRPDRTGKILLDWMASHADSNGLVKAAAPSLAKALGEARRDGSECAGQAPGA
jgi:hypothetical protein